MPPSIEKLRERLVGRGTETATTLETRVGNATQEVDTILSKPEIFQYRILNDNQHILMGRQMNQKNYNDDSSMPSQSVSQSRHIFEEDGQLEQLEQATTNQEE